MESSFLRDQSFELNGERMTKTKRRFTISFRFGIISGLIVTYLSVIRFLQCIGKMMAEGMIQGIIESWGAEYTGEQYRLNVSGFLITIVLGIAVIILSLIANRFYNKLSHWLLYGAYVMFFAVGLCALCGLWDDMTWVEGIISGVYGLIGFLTADLTHRALKELDFLVTQEGFPDFNLGMHYMGRSHYVKLREAWEKKNKKYDYYSESERPTENVTITAAETADGMDGVAASAEDGEKWFINNKLMSAEIKEQAQEENAMDGIDCGEIVLPEDEQYYRDKADPKRRELY